MAAERESIDPTLSALMREHSTETPPAHVDAAILAAAHASVASASGDRSVSLQHDAGAPALARVAFRWWMPLAVAAVIGVIAIGVLPLAPSIVEDDTAQRASDMPAESVRPSAPIGSVAPVTQEAAAPRPRQEASPPPRAAAPLQRKQQQETRELSDPAALPGADVPERSLADWVARLRALRDSGDSNAALRELRRYRASFKDADERLPPDLADWARSLH